MQELTSKQNQRDLILITEGSTKDPREHRKYFICKLVFKNFPGTYSPEKQKYPYHKYPPQYSFGARTRTGKKDQTPGPNTYNLPGILGPKAVGKKSAPSYSLVGRSKIGGFHEDLQKVKCVVMGGRFKNITKYSLPYHYQNTTITPTALSQQHYYHHHHHHYTSTTLLLAPLNHHLLTP